MPYLVDLIIKIFWLIVLSVGISALIYYGSISDLLVCFVLLVVLKLSLK
jgi:hypothetical protein